MRWPWSWREPSTTGAPDQDLMGRLMPAPWHVPPTPAPAVRFKGVCREEVLDCGLYEVDTTGGVPVRLHDMSFLDLLFEATSPPSLRLRFVYDDPEWTPEEAAATPVAVFTFGGAVVLGSEDERHDDDNSSSWRRQVQDFRYHDATAIFGLQTSTTNMVFSAATCTLTLEPLEASSSVAEAGGGRGSTPQRGT